VSRELLSDLFRTVAAASPSSRFYLRFPTPTHHPVNQIPPKWQIRSCRVVTLWTCKFPLNHPHAIVKILEANLELLLKARFGVIYITPGHLTWLVCTITHHIGPVKVVLVLVVVVMGGMRTTHTKTIYFVRNRITAILAYFVRVFLH